MLTDASRPALTTRQREVLDCIANHIRTHGYPPTLREIGERVGLQSTNGVSEHVQALARKGYVELTPDKSRGIRLLVQLDPLAKLTEGVRALAADMQVDLGPADAPLPPDWLERFRLALIEMLGAARLDERARLRRDGAG